MAHRPSEVLSLAPGTARTAPGWRSWRLAPAGLVPWLAARLLEERERWLLWLPVAVGAGVAVYFALPREPPLWLALLLPLAPLLALGWLWGKAASEALAAQPVVLIALTASLIGFACASLRTQMVAAPALERRGAYQAEGRVRLVEDRVRGRRLVLDRVALDGIAPAATPRLVRISVRDHSGALGPGDRIRVRAMLMPPSAPSEPRGFHFARQAYFLRLGAVGYALGRWQRLEAANGDDWRLGLARVRQHVAAAVHEAVPERAGAVGVALLTGLRGAIPEQVWHDMQVAGIAHLLAISGLHLGLVAGTLFFAARIGLALVPPLALRLPGKKVAAAIALVGAFLYLLLTGATVPTQRAFFMTALVLTAVMTDRNPFSMRLVAWAALLVLLTQPESLLGASFQMSFSAVVALVAVYESGLGQHRDRLGGLDWRLALYVGGVALTTIVATLATAPLAVYHFGRLPTYGIVANLIAVPVTAFWIMPLGLLGLLVLPLGLGGVCFALMGHGIELVLAVAGTVARWPGAALLVAKPPDATLVAVVLGGLWLALWRGTWRRLGLIGLLLGLTFALLDVPPDVLVDRRGRLAAVRLNDQLLAISPWQRDRWVTSGWLRTAGQAEAASWPEPGTSSEGPLRCDALGCTISRRGQTVALTRRPDGLEDDCALADLVVSYPRIERCPNGTRLIGPRALERAGGLAVWLGAGGIEALSVRAVRGERPWVR